MANLSTATTTILAEVVFHLQILQQCQLWYRTSCNLEPGEVILLREDNTPPFQWPTATTTETSTKTGVVRVVTLNAPKGH